MRFSLWKCLFELQNTKVLTCIIADPCNTITMVYPISPIPNKTEMWSSCGGLDPSQGDTLHQHGKEQSPSCNLLRGVSLQGCHELHQKLQDVVLLLIFSCIHFSSLPRERPLKWVLVNNKPGKNQCLLPPAPVRESVAGRAHLSGTASWAVGLLCTQIAVVAIRSSKIIYLLHKSLFILHRKQKPPWINTRKFELLNSMAVHWPSVSKALQV